MGTKSWNLLPWNKAEYSIGFLQNSLYKSSKKKDSCHIYKIRSRLQNDPRSQVLSLRKVFSENDFLYRERFNKETIETNSCSLVKLLNQREISSLQKLKLVDLCFSDKQMSLPFLTNSMVKKKEKYEKEKKIEMK